MACGALLSAALLCRRDRKISRCPPRPPESRPDPNPESAPRPVLADACIDCSVKESITASGEPASLTCSADSACKSTTRSSSTF